MFDEQFDALRNARRRRLLLDVERSNPRANGGSFDPSRDTEDLIVLRHVHLPKLEAYGYVSWDREANEVARGPRFDEIRPLLGFLHEHAGDSATTSHPEATDVQ